MRRNFWNLTGCFSLAAVALFIISCKGIHYEGISEPPLPEDVKVEVYFEKSQVPVKEYRVLGQASFETAPNTPHSNIRERLQAFAREHGANGVLILSMDKVKTSEAREDQIYNRPAPGWNVEDNSNTAYTYMRDTILFSSGSDPDKAIYSIQVIADLFVTPGMPGFEEK